MEWSPVELASWLNTEHPDLKDEGILLQGKLYKLKLIFDSVVLIHFSVFFFVFFVCYICLLYGVKVKEGDE